MTSRELVLAALTFTDPPRVPRQLWSLPWAASRYPEELARIERDFPPDIVSAPMACSEMPPTSGDQYAAGEYVDEFGCTFVSIAPGYIGEIKNPLIKDEGWADAENVRFPEERMTLDVDAVNRFCAGSGSFVLAAACPRPFERLQFLRGTGELYIDLALRPSGMFDFIGKLHDHYLRWLDLWARTDVDGLMMMDDWGSQSALLIDPEMWRRFFKPLYADYIDIAHRAGKKAFMHSDGYIADIIPDLIELGLDALNSQIFCMGVDTLKPFRGEITFWGEIDSQHLLPRGSREEIFAAVDSVRRALWAGGGCIAQCEFGPGAKPENVYAVFEAWNR